MDNMSIPKHIGFIMDGNGRWAKKRGLPRSMGHRAGVNALKKVITACHEFNIPYITVFAFSTENWSRPADEVEALFDMVIDFNKKELNSLIKNGVRLMFSGNIGGLPDELQESIKTVTEKTKDCKDMVLNVALNYGGREEILQAVNTAIKNGKEVTAEDFEKLLYTYGIPMPDLIVRSSGEQRISNFLLYQSAYSELMFVDTLWPDFNKKQIVKILEDYSRRERRFGGI